MSVYKHPGSPFYLYDFQWRGRRFHGSTKCTSRREAEQVEKAERERATQEATRAKVSSASLQFDDVAGRYWQEVGKHHAGSSNTWRDISRLVDYFGATRLLTEITDDDVAKLVAWRRGHRTPLLSLRWKCGASLRARRWHPADAAGSCACAA